MAFIQPKLGYELGSLTPFLSEEQMSYHYGKHHATYFKKLNDLTAGKPEEKKTLEELIKSATGAVFNNAAQAWNHSFFWNCLNPGGKSGQPKGELVKSIEKSFGSFEEFKKKFTDSAVGLFGSGWVWLAKNGSKLEIISTQNGDTPLKEGKTPLLTIDVWEHAYYVDYRNDRAKFVSTFWDYVNWDFVEKNL